jgi:hypothetical protein
VQDIGWRYLLDTLNVAVPVRSPAQAAEVAAAAVAAGGQDADGHPGRCCNWNWPSTRRAPAVGSGQLDLEIRTLIIVDDPG